MIDISKRIEELARNKDEYITGLLNNYNLMESFSILIFCQFYLKNYKTTEGYTLIKDDDKLIDDLEIAISKVRNKLDGKEL